MRSASFRLTVSEKAKADLRAIHVYIAKDNKDAADIFIKDVTDKLYNLAFNGVKGASRDWISRGLRVFPYRERCFYFRIKDDEMRVIRVLHQKQDVNAHGF